MLSVKDKRVGSFNLLEVLIYFLCVSLLVGLFYIGFAKRENQLYDEKRVADVGVVIQALEDYYNNSNFIPEKRQYPISLCSNTVLNSVDYEFVVKKALVGKEGKIDTFEYIKPSNYSNDPKAKTTPALKNRPDNQDCFSNMSTQTIDEYLPITGNSCLFDGGNYKYCYLYTSSVTGDSFRIAYYSEAKKSFVIYEKFRDGDLKITYQNI